VAQVVAKELPERLAREDRERTADEHDVHDHVERAAGEGEEGDAGGVQPWSLSDEECGQGRGEGGEPVDRRVEERAHEGPALDHLGDENAADRAEDGVLPAEEDLARHDEDERERDDALVLDVERDGLHVREEREPEEEDDADPGREARRLEGDPHHRPGSHRQSDAENGGDVPVKPGRVSVGIHGYGELGEVVEAGCRFSTSGTRHRLQRHKP
jgi:hypothetical protein